MSSAGTTVIIPVHDGERFLGEALDSVLAQTRPVHQIIVVDDGSTDGSVAVASSRPGVTVLTQANAGPAAARNAGLAVATGGYIAMLDADDQFPPDRNEVMSAVLDAHPEVGIVMGNQRLLVEEGATLPAWVPPLDGIEDLARIDPSLLPRPTGAGMARKAVYDAIGGYAEDMRHGEDSDWFLRARDAGFRTQFIEDVILVRRIHGANLTHDTEGQRLAMFDVLQRRMARRREGGEGPA